MASSVLLELDTTPPEVTFTSAYITGDTLYIAYDITEPSIITAELVGVGPLTVGADTLTLSMVGPPTEGDVSVVVRDDVDNEQTQTYHYMTMDATDNVVVSVVG